jgi:V-type H+-transporting ATPase subunit C
MLMTQAGTLSSLLTLSDQLPKLDSTFTGIVSKLLDTLRSLVEDPSQLPQHARVNDQAAEKYLIPGTIQGWRWDTGRWGSGGKVGEIVDALTKVGRSFRGYETR